MADQWHVTRDEKKSGPFSSTALRRLAVSGKLLPSDQIWKEGMTKSVPASKVKGLFSDASSSAPSPSFSPTPSPPPQPISSPPPVSSPPPPISSLPPVPNQHSGETAQPASPAPVHSFLERAKAGAADLAAKAKAAAQLASKQAEKTKIVQLTLPSAYQALGKQVHSEGRLRERFGKEFLIIDDFMRQLESIKTAAAARSAPQGAGEKAKAIAVAAKAMAEAKTIQMRLSHAFGELGKAAFESDRERSGPDSFVRPISGFRARVEALENEIGNLELAHKGSWITPKRLMIGGGIAGVFLILGFVGSLSSSEKRLGVSQPRAVSQRDSSSNTISIEMIEIPAGTFTMGSPAGEKDRENSGEEQVVVMLTNPFWLGKTEVTQGQWQQVMGTKPWLKRGINSLLHKWDAADGRVQIDEDNAASFVTWGDATEFCQTLTDTDHKNGKLPAGESYRLPTEAEWEYACRAGTTTAYSFGDDEKQLGNYGWFAGNTAGELHAHKVGMKKPNPWGLYDMHGNVWEMCSNVYVLANTRLVAVGKMGCTILGGSGRDSHCRSACRKSDDEYMAYSNKGFRVARSQSVPYPYRPPQQTVGIEMIEIPAGKFTMGSPHRELEAQANVTLTKPFWLGKTEVTQGQWQQVMGTEPWLKQGGFGHDKNGPAIDVSKVDALEFCETLTDIERKAGKLKAGESYRLPTEAEWEYACRAGTTTAFSFVEDESKLGEFAWFDGNTKNERYAHKVGLKKPNPWGLYDMHGNVQEFVRDGLKGKLPGGTDPGGPDSETGEGYVNLRGGGWKDTPDYCRSPYRGNGRSPSYSSRDGGFRVARSQSAQ